MYTKATFLNRYIDITQQITFPVKLVCATVSNLDYCLKRLKFQVFQICESCDNLARKVHERAFMTDS